MAIDRPNDFKIAGRLSYPYLTAKSAYDSAHRKGSKLKPALRPKTVEEATANFQILLNQFGFEKTLEQLENSVLPWFKQEAAAGASGVSTTPDIVDQIFDAVKSGDPFKAPGLNMPFTKPSDSTLELMPNAVAALTIKAYKPGTDFKQEAFVTSEDQLVSKVFTKKQLFPISDTEFEMYPGCYVKAGINFWLGDVNGTPYLKANTNALAFWKDGDSFVTGGGSDIDLLGIEEDDDMFDD